MNSKITNLECSEDLANYPPLRSIDLEAGLEKPVIYRKEIYHDRNKKM